MAAQKNVAEVRRLTQEELLKEAKITEAENLQSLGNYRLLRLYVDNFTVLMFLYQFEYFRDFF